jgi:HAD superfamily hydrolase (TIGR01509 family)
MSDTSRPAGPDHSGLQHPVTSTVPDGVVFDLDGTMVDNMALHVEAFAIFAQRHGLPPLTTADRVRLDGKRNSEIFPILFGRAMDEPEWRAYEDEKESLYREISVGRLQPLRGLPRLLDAIAARGIPVALATSAPAENVTHTLEEIGLPHPLDIIVRGDQVPRGKPAPDVFLAAAGRLGVRPDRCLAFEDAPMGVAAAKAAGMTCVALATSFHAAHWGDADPAPDLIVRDFEEYLAGPGRWLVE